MTPEEYQDAKQAIKKHRVEFNFEQKYSEIGGLAKLNAMMKGAATCKQMADYFGVAPSRMVIITENILGMPYSQYLIQNKVRRPGVWRKGGRQRGRPREVADEAMG